MYEDTLAGWMAAGSPVNVNVVALLVLCNAGKVRKTRFPTRAQYAVPLGAVPENPVPVIVKLPRSGVISTSAAAVGPHPLIVGAAVPKTAKLGDVALSANRYRSLMAPTAKSVLSEPLPSHPS